MTWPQVIVFAIVMGLVSGLAEAALTDWIKWRRMRAEGRRFRRRGNRP